MIYRMYLFYLSSNSATLKDVFADIDKGKGLPDKKNRPCVCLTLVEQRRTKCISLSRECSGSVDRSLPLPPVSRMKGEVVGSGDTSQKAIQLHHIKGIHTRCKK